MDELKPHSFAGVLLGMLLVVGCASGVDYVEETTLRGRLYLIEYTTNNYWHIWMMSLSKVAFCTNDEELGTKAVSLLSEYDGDVILVFRQISQEEDSLCMSTYSGRNWAANRHMLLDIYPVGQ